MGDRSPCEVDPAALEELLVRRFVAGEGAPFRAVQRRLPGHYLELTTDHLTVRPYWKATDHGGGPSSGSPCGAAAHLAPELHSNEVKRQKSGTIQGRFWGKDR